MSEVTYDADHLVGLLDDCPWCGSGAVSIRPAHHTEPALEAWCSECGLVGPRSGEDDMDAVDQWNSLSTAFSESLASWVTGGIRYTLIKDRNGEFDVKSKAAGITQPEGTVEPSIARQIVVLAQRRQAIETPLLRAIDILDRQRYRLLNGEPFEPSALHEALAQLNTIVRSTEDTP